MITQNSFLTPDELRETGFRSVGDKVLISRFARFYGAEKMTIGDNVRIDDFCILSGEINLGNFIHISAYSALYGRYGIEMNDYSGLSPRCTVFSATDDFSGDWLIGPMVDQELTNVTGGRVAIGRFSQLGSGCVVLPGASIGEGVTVGAMSLIIHNLDDWGIYKGIPALFYKKRSKKLLDLLK
ncbi:MAG: acyltransferase [Bacteroidales bacterium]|jgi:galactoside O-acetyltransferase|nr:acyltransferase [Bacteroidales bacterium]